MRTHSHRPSCAGLRDVEVVGEVAPAAQQHRRRRRQRFVELAHGDLLQVGVVEPDARAVGDDDLAVRLAIVPAKAIRTRDRQRAARFVDRLAVAIREACLNCACSPSRPCRKLRRASGRPAALAPRRKPYRRCGEKRSARRRGARSADASSGSLFGRRRAPALRACRWTATGRRGRPPPSSRSCARRGCSRSSGAAARRRSMPCGSRRRCARPGRTADPARRRLRPRRFHAGIARLARHAGNRHASVLRESRRM